MLKNLLIIVSIIAGPLLVTLAYLWGSNINKEEINQFKIEMQRLQSSRDSIQAIASLKDSLQIMLMN